MCRQVPAAQGRYILSHDSTVSTKFLSDILSEHFPQYSFPAGDDTPSERLVDNSKVSFLPFLGVPNIQSLTPISHISELFTVSCAQTLEKGELSCPLVQKWQRHITTRLGDYGECNDASALVHTSEMQMLYFISCAHAGVASSA